MICVSDLTFVVLDLMLLHIYPLILLICDLEADKKAYVETTQWTLKQNKDEMNKLRVNNKNLAEEVSSIKKVLLNLFCNYLVANEYRILIVFCRR